MAGAGSLGARVWVALGLVYVIWGSTYLGIKWGVDTLPPLPMLGFRFVVAGALLFAWCARRGLPRTTRRQWVAAAIVGVLLPGFGNGGVGWAETRISSGLAALIIAVIPLWIVVIERVLYGRRLSRTAAVGVALGFGGVALLVDPTGGAGRELAAMGVLVCSSLAWAAGSLYAIRAPRPADPLVGVSMQMLAGGVALCVAGAGQWDDVDLAAVSAKSLWALVYLIAIGSLVGYSAYGYLLTAAPASIVATYAYVNPVVAVALGALLAGEAVTGRTLLAGAVIVLAVALIIGAPRRPEPARAEPELTAAREAA